MLTEIQAAIPAHQFQAVTFDKMWLSRLVADFPDPNGDGNLCFLLRQFGVGDDGRAVFAPGNPLRVDINEALAKAHSSPALQDALNALMRAVAEAAGLPVRTLRDFSSEKAESAPLPKRRPTKAQLAKAKDDELVKSLANSARRRSRLIAR
jgi:hypothetical protein